jgi:hypothetical protein
MNIINKGILDRFEDKLSYIGYDSGQVNEIMRMYYEALSEFLTKGDEEECKPNSYNQYP